MASSHFVTISFGRNFPCALRIPRSTNRLAVRANVSVFGISLNGVDIHSPTCIPKSLDTRSTDSLRVTLRATPKLPSGYPLTTPLSFRYATASFRDELGSISLKFPFDARSDSDGFVGEITEGMTVLVGLFELTFVSLSRASDCDTG